MKTRIRISDVARGSTLALTLAALTTASLANAQYKSTGDDGIAASPKVRAQLEERKARINTAAPAMACPKCKDGQVSMPVKGAKGAQVLLAGGIPTQKVVRHLCASCDTTISIVGLSKATKRETTTHNCTGCGVENLLCCNTKTGSDAATRGMENKFEIAPLK